MGSGSLAYDLGLIAKCEHIVVSGRALDKGVDAGQVNSKRQIGRRVYRPLEWHVRGLAFLKCSVRSSIVDCV